MYTRSLLIALFVVALFPAAVIARPRGGGCAPRPVMLAPGQGFGYTQASYNRCNSRPAYGYGSGFGYGNPYNGFGFGNPYNGFGFGNFGFGNYGYNTGYYPSYSRPSDGGSMVLPKWNTRQVEQQLEVKESKPELELPEIR